jgi:hypothetical protein
MFILAERELISQPFSMASHTEIRRFIFCLTYILTSATTSAYHKYSCYEAAATSQGKLKVMRHAIQIQAECPSIHIP